MFLGVLCFIGVIVLVIAGIVGASWLTVTFAPILAEAGISIVYGLVAAFVLIVMYYKIFDTLLY